MSEVFQIIRFLIYLETWTVLRGNKDNCIIVNGHNSMKYQISYSLLFKKRWPDVVKYSKIDFDWYVRRAQSLRC